MLVKRNGIFKTIQSSEYGIYQKAGFEKVLDIDKKVKEKPLPKLETIVEEKEELPELKEIEEEKPQQQKPQQYNGKNKKHQQKN